MRWDVVEITAEELRLVVIMSNNQNHQRYPLKKTTSQFLRRPTTGIPITGSSLKEVDMLPYLYTHKTSQSCIIKGF